MTNRSTLRTSMALASVAGLALSAMVAVADPPQNQDRNQDQSRQMQDQAQHTSPDFRTFSAIKGWTVENQAGDKLGSISDFVIDRGDGRIKFVVLSHGDVLGIGGSNRLLKPDALQWRAEKERATLNMTEKEIESLPKLDSMNWNRENEKVLAGHEDAYSRFIQSTNDRKTVRGEVTDVNRRMREGREELVVLTIKTDDGQSRDIITGPTWFVMSRQTAPRRGEMVELEVAPLPDDREAWGVATVAMLDGERVQLRDRNGAPAWGDASRSKAEYGAPAHPFVQISDIVGAPVVTKKRDAGEVQEAILDLNGHRVQFLAIDPNENFLGMADTLRLVPWRIARYAVDEQVDIDATDQMILSSPEMPDDASRLNAASFRDSVYTHFGVRPVGEEMRQGPTARGAWDMDQKMRQALNNGDPGRVSGKLVERRTVNDFPGANEPVTVLMIRTDDGERRAIHVGPEARVKRMMDRCRNGDEVTVEYRTIRLDGERYMVATRLHHDGNVMTLWTPSSDQSDSRRR